MRRDAAESYDGVTTEIVVGFVACGLSGFFLGMTCALFLL